MGYKANIDIALSFSHLKVSSVRQQGRIKFRTCLYYAVHQQKSKKEQIQFCHPYSIIRRNDTHINLPQNNKNNDVNLYSQNDRNRNLRAPQNFNPFQHTIEQSELDLNSDYYLSKPFKMIFQRQHHAIMETCNFCTYIDIEKYSDVNLKCMVELLFCPNTMSEETAVFKIIGKCQLKIRRLFDMSTYFPIVFDQFQGVAIQGIYQAALIDFRYEKDVNLGSNTNIGVKVQNPDTFHQYLKTITNGFNRADIRNFYRYYREILEKQLFSIQERHYDLLRVLGVNSFEQFRMLKINSNSKIQAMIDHLGGYNSHQNPYNFGTQRNISSKESLSTNTSPEDIPYLNRGIILRGEQQFRTPVASDKYKEELSEEIVYDFLTIKAHIFKKWSDFLDFTTKNIVLISEKYKASYDSLVKQRLSGNVFSHKVNVSDWKKSVYKDSGKDNLKFAETDRRKILKEQQLWKQAFLIENENFFGKDSKNIKIFEQIYQISYKIQNTRSQKSLLRKSLDHNSNFQPFIVNNYPKIKRLNSESQGRIEYPYLSNSRKNTMPPTSTNSFKIQQQLQGIQLMVSNVGQSIQNITSEDNDHFIVLVHGFQASRQDFILLKNCLQIRFKIKVFISTCNEGRTDDDIQIQGKRLANQIKRYLNDSNPSYNYRLSFLGHSMGGVIIRTALCHLQNVQKHLYSFVTLSAPHIGYLYEPETHIQAGLWFINNWHKATSIQQLCVRDKQDLRQTFLYKLSKSKTMDKFKNIALVGSSQDKYVPYESARIQQNVNLIKDYISTQNGHVINQMIDSMLGSLQCKQISRMDVIFNIQQSNFDSMIGRTAHIRYLSDRQFIKVFCIVFEKFFK